MVVKTMLGDKVSFVNTDKKCLFDGQGTAWVRDPSVDDFDRRLIGYANSQNTAIKVQLTVDDFKRVMDGEHMMNTPTSLDEMREYAKLLHKSLAPIVDQWPDQKLREILMDAEESHKHPGLLMERYAQAQWEEEHPPKMPTGATGGHTGVHETQKTTKNTPRPRKQEGSVTVAVGGVSVLLTPKQLEFMERLSECPGWEKQGITGEYVASEYAMELADSMNPMSVGAVVTTLREKHVLQTEKRRIGAIKCCVFKLTDLGIEVYNILAEGVK